MDVLTHAAVGYAIAGWQGALVAAAPDVALAGRRRHDTPTQWYRATHSAAIALPVVYAAGGAALAVAYLSHLALDASTHRGAFASQPLWPVARWSLEGAQEWEWFNGAWWLGAFQALAMCAIALWSRA